MMELEICLKRNAGLSASELRDVDPDTYAKLVAYAKSINKLPLHVLKVFTIHGEILSHANCVVCGKSFNVYEHKGLTCST